MAMKFLEFAAVLTLVAIATHAATFPIAKPGCADRCGDVSIPYPFGTTEGCYLNANFFVNCSRTARGGHSPFWGNTDIDIKNIALESGQITVMQFVGLECYNRNGTTVDYAKPRIWVDPWTISNTANKFVVVGCDTTASISGHSVDDRFYETGCTATCGGEDDLEYGTYSGLGCYMSSIPRNVQQVNISIDSSHNYTNVWNFSSCGYAFVVDESAFTFSPENITNLRKVNMLPMVVDWSIGEACTSSSNNACKSENSVCYEPYNSLIGYVPV